MRVEYINPFVETSYRVLKEVLGGAEVKRGDLYLKSTAMPVMGVAALVGLAGDVEGRVLFDMSFETALNIASEMNMEKLTAFEKIIYGDAEIEARLPLPDEVKTLFAAA